MPEESVCVQILASDPKPVYVIAEQVLGRRVSNQTIRTWSTPGKGRRGAVLPVVYGLGGTRLTTVERFREFWAASEADSPAIELSPRERAGVSDADADEVLRALGVKTSGERRAR